MDCVQLQSVMLPAAGAATLDGLMSCPLGRGAYS